MILTVDTWEWGLSKKKKSQCFWLVKYWWNLISCLICTKPIFKQVLLTYLLTHQKKWGVGWKWTTGGIVLITCPFLKLRLPCKSFYLGYLLTFFFPTALFFYWVVDWVWLGILWSFMDVEFYKEINFVSMKSIYIILNISRTEMVC